MYRTFIYYICSMSIILSNITYLLIKSINLNELIRKSFQLLIYYLLSIYFFNHFFIRLFLKLLIYIYIYIYIYI
jgi:hypothetical protein